MADNHTGPRTAHIGNVEGTDLIAVWCDRHGDVIETPSHRIAEAAVRLHDLCKPLRARDA